ncbi:uncharacterized protein K02A2.6-like [Mizuhopecten yessoensis]|uniref:uncharacterized protein K02A2.6-like n=1 Tax=Mizuhopecten yessoensis TaxID=6573 RepID=UPI000B45C86D|nr:uncharacterized protein K02A2.6-like [Mizuhopecten yessoensis]
MDNKLPTPKSLSFYGNVSENWRRWLQQYRLYMTATAGDELTEKKQCAMFLTLAGETAVEIFNKMTFEANEQDKIASLIEKFTNYCSPKKNVTYERHVFNSRAQKSDETFDEFLTDLRILQKNCEFGELKDGILRDKIVEGIRNDGLRARLLREGDLSLQKCIDLCKAASMTEKHMKTLALTENKEQDVDYIRSRGKSRSRGTGRNSGRGSSRKVNTEHTDGQKSRSTTCSYCAMVHRGNLCPARGQTCRLCGKRNHFAKACKSKQKKATDKTTQQVHAVENYEHELFIDSVEYVTSNVWLAPLEVHGNLIPLKIDTGSDVNIIPKEEFDKLRNKPRIHKTKVKLTAYNAGQIEAVGQCVCEVKHKNKKYKVLFIVCPGNVKPIIGRKSSEAMGLVKLVLSVERKQSIVNTDHIQKPKVKVEQLSKESIEEDYSDVFQGLGCLPGKVSIKLQPNSEPTIDSCRKLPFAQHDQVKKELDQMVEMKVIEKVEKPTEWVSALVIVPKPNGKLRLCLDPRNLNKYIRREHFKLPTREEIMSKFAGAKVFSKLDASSGFWQLQLDEDSSDLCTFITPFGRYQFKRLPFGISCAPEMYHRNIHTLFENLSGVDTSMDDIIIWGTSVEEHAARVRQVLEVARESNLKLNPDKSVIGVQELTFLGDTITSEGIKPDNKKVTAIVEI